MSLGEQGWSEDTHAANVSYIYDELGRLKAVIDPAGNTALYTYDAVGNLLGITRQSSGQVAIIQFVPDEGPEGTSVTISGIGFSATPGQNTVTFNGTAASVISATTTEIVTTVPVGATTGTLSVTSPLGTDTSSQSFTVTTNSGAPTISSINPTLAIPSTAITIDGTNFDPIPGNSKVYFNVTKDLGASVSANSISTTVPSSATSGPVKISTLQGTALGPDLFIPPSTYTVSQVEQTNRISPGGSPTNVSIANQNNIALLIFDGNGTAGQRVSVEISQGGTSQYFLYSPNGTSLGGAGTVSGNGFLDAKSLTNSGTYSLMLKNISTTPITNALLTLHDIPPDPIAAILPGGPPVLVTTTVPGQNAQLPFQGTAGQRISLNVTQGSLSFVRIFNVDGTLLASSTTSIFGNTFVDTQSLGATGSFTILLDPLDARTVSDATFTLYDVPPDITGSIAINGAGVSIPITAPGQNGLLTFAGEANVEVTVKVTGNTMNNVMIRIKRADGTLVTQQGSGLATFSLTPQILPATETYTIQVDPLNAVTGTLTLSVSSPDVTPPVVSAISSTRVTGTEATMTWTTDEAADSQVEYGKTTAYGNTSLLAPALVTSHSVMLTGLSEYTVYHYRVKSRDAAGNLTTSGDSTFTTGSIVHGSHRDFNGDGKADFLWRDSTTGTVSIWLMNGVTVASSGTLSGAGLNWALEGMGDTNGDGKADLIWRDPSTGITAIWLMNGLTVASSGTLSGVGLNWRINEVGDVNGDGKADLIWRDATTGTVNIWLMNGVTVASSGTLGAVGLTWAMEGMGDTNGDGKADLIWRNLSTGSTAIYLMNGLTIASTGFPGGAGLNWAIKKVGDVNGDGKADLIWRDANTGTVSIWLMNGLTVTSTGSLNGAGFNWSLRGIGDTDGNSKADLMWRDLSTGSTAIWLMNGLTIASSGFPGGVGLNWVLY